MTSCVNKLSKEFKGLCSKFNVSPNTMELIIHKYWDERHSDRFYPSDAYIDAQLGNSPYKETLDAVIRVWNQKYTKPQVFKSSHDFIKARNEALRIFPNDALVSYRDSNKNFVFRIRKPVKNLKGEYKKALNNNGWGKKKNADSGNDARDIQLYIDNASPKKTTGQTYFTFKDGIRLQTPFTVNEQQANALNELDKFLDSDDNVITLSGYAGTGKTSLMQIFKQKALMKGHMVSFSATTNKAAAVLQSKVKNASTLHHLFGIQAGVDLNNEYDLSRLVNTINDENKLVPGQVVVIDEASMIGKPLYDMINQIANKEGVKIIYLGDKAQLAPVNETQISPIFKNPKGKVLELTKVERTGDNAILKEATAIRNGKGFSYDSSFNSEGKGVAFIDPSKDKKEVVDIIKHYAPLVKKDPDSFKILAYTNAKVAQYNNYIRKLLGYNTPVPRVGETIMGYKNCGYSKGKYKIINSENYKVTKVYDKPISEDIEGQSVEYYLAEVEDYEGNTKGIKLVDIKNNIKNRQAVTALGKKVSQLWSTYRSTPYNNRREILDTINGIEQALFVNDDIKERNRTIVQKAWDYGYAMTVHKSQGSTFKNVFIDDNDIQSARPAPILEDAEDVGDFGDMAAILAEEGEDVSSLTNQEINSNQDANNKPDLISQLEYVAVSRATDTATVLSSMTKKEGSPLHPEKLISTQLSKPDNVSKSNAHTEPNKPISSTITQQVVDHLKSIPGINVLGRSAMETFLKTHNVIGLQQYITKNSLPKGEVAVLSSTLMSKYGNNPSYGDVIQTANYEYIVNYKGAGEFDIIEYHQIDNNLNERINDRERKGFPESPDRWSTRNEITQRQYKSDSYHVEDREANGNNAGLDIQTLQGKSKQTSSNDGSSQHKEWREIKKDSATGRISFIDGDGRTVDTTEDWNSTQAFTTPQGEVYGFVDKEGNVYLDETKISPNHPIHEYTHLWDRTVQQKNPKLWQRGVELMKQTSMWKTIANDAHYGKTWEAMNLPQEKLDNLIASEVHARLTGEGGEQLLNNLAKEKGQSNIIEKLKQWILDVWKDLKATFGSWSQEDLDSLTLKDFNHMTVRDFTNGVNLKAASTVTYTDSNNNENADLGNFAERPFTVKGDDIDAYDYEKDFSFKSVEAAYQAAKANYADLSEEEISKWIEKIQACNTAEEARKIGEQIPNLDTETWDKYSPSILKFLVKESFMQNPKAMQQLLNTDDSTLTGKDKNNSNILIQARNELKNEINNNGNDTINNEGQRSDVENNNQTMSQEEIKNNILNTLSKGAFTMTTNSSGDITDFNSIRQYYMYQKALAFGDDETADKILDAKNDNEVAKLNKQIKDVDVQQWAKLAPSIMRVGLLSLFEQNSEALKALINADHDTLSKIEEESKMGHGFTSFLESVQGELDTKYNKPQTDGNDSSQLDLNEPTDMSETKITLPAFRHFEYGDKVGSQQEVTVDAQWKVPILRSLDSMIYSPEDEIDEELMSPEQKANNKSLIIQIYAIMHMRDKHDYTDIKRRTKLYRDEREVYEQDLVDSQMNYLLSQGKEGNKANKVTVYNSFDDLRDSNLLSEASPSKIREIANMIMDYASSIITKLQTKDGYAKAMFPDIKAVSDGFDFKSASRQEVINAIGITNIFNKVREFFDPDKSPIREEYDKNGVANKLRMMVDSCWEAFLRIGEAQFQFNEGLRIKEDFTNKTFSTVEDNNTSISDDVDDFNENNDEDSLSEKVGDTQEAWQVNTLTRSVLQSMSTVVKSALHDCLQVDKNGKYITHPWFKVALRVDPVSATKSILYFTKGATTYESMVEKLSDAAKNKGNLWMNQLLKKLKDNTGKYTDFQSQFFTTFFKSKMPYAVTIDNNGTISSIQANSSIVLKSLMNEAITKFKTKRHPLFTSNGMNKQYLGSRNTVGEGYSFNLYQALEKICNTLSKYHQARLYTIDRDNRRKGLVAGTQHWNVGTWGYFDFNGYSDEDITYMAKEFSKAFQVLGFNIDSDTIEMTLTKEGAMDMANTLQSIIKTLTKAADNPSYNPFDFKDGNSILSYLRKMIGIAVEPLEAVSTNTVYNNGKTYQEYVTPSFLSKLLSKLGTTNGEELEANLEKNYAWSQFYCSGTDRDGVYRYRVPLLKKIAEQGGSLLFEHKINLSFNDHAYMKNMNSLEYALSVFAQYWAITKANGMEVAYYRIPMQSNKPTEDYIGTYCYRDPDYKENVKNDLYDMFLIELSRIQTVRMRNRTKKNVDYIKNFDDRGRKFCFFPFLNDYLDSDGGSLLSEDGSISPDDSELARLLQKKIKGEEALSSTEEVTLQDLTKKAFESYLNNKTVNMLREWKRNSILKAARNINNILDPVYHEDIKNPYNEETNPELYRQRENEIDAIIAKYLENFIWNDYNMAKNILMVTVGDIAFYKDTEDLQKRLAQLHAPGVRARVSATDYQGNKVSDGYYRTLVLKDWDSYISNIKANLNEVFNELIEKAPDNMKSQYRALKENVLRAYSEINVADAEGYTGPTAYRKKALMFGRWSKEFENVYQKLMKGEHDLTTLKAAFQPLKPFVYSNQLKKDMSVEGAPIQTMACPFQAKNSEYLLIMADALMREHDTSRPNLLKAITDVMEDSAFDGRTRNEDDSIKNYGTYNGRGIDTIQFESAIKSSLQGAINIFDNANDEKKGTKEVYDKLMGALYKKGTHDYNTDLYVQEVPYEDYCLQQEVPDHFIDHEQAHGSQIRAIIPSDLEEYYDPQKEHNEENTVYYEWEEWQKVPSEENPDRLTWKKVKVKVNAQQYREMYENTIASNINMSIEDLKKELNLDTANRREANFALSKILKKEILSSSRYGLDMLTACSIDKETGEFKLPLGDPIQCKQFEQLLNSIIKNRVNKQKIPGGPVVQVSNFGASKQLHIRFKDKTGNLIPLEEEYKAEEHKGMSYEEYCKENQDGIAYFEVFAPIWSQDLVDKFGDENGNIDIEAIEAVDPNLLKLITYRIPTEDKYSMAPCKIVGFLPREAGSTIMLPYELTTQDGSDFDIDKRYVMRKDLHLRLNERKMRNKVTSIIKADLVKSEAKRKGIPKSKVKVNLRSIRDNVDLVFDLMKQPNAERLLSPNEKAIAQYVDKLKNDKKLLAYCYSTDIPNGRTFNNNRIIDMSWAVLTHKTQANKVLNPGGFDEQKAVGYMIEAYKNFQGTWNELERVAQDKDGIKRLKKLSYKDKDLATFDTQLQFYKQNQAAGNTLGVFAVNKVSHALLESDHLYLKLSDILGSNDWKINIAGKTFSEYLSIDPSSDWYGNPIGKTLGSLVGASADAAKDPILNLMNIDMDTVNILNAMLRTGVPFKIAALFLSQDIISKVLDETTKRNIDGYTSINNVVYEYVQKMTKENGFREGNNIYSEGLSTEELITGLREGDHASSDFKVLLAFQKFTAIAEALRKPTLITRFNSVSTAVGPLAIDNLMTQYSVGNFDPKHSPFYKVDDSGKYSKIGALDIFNNHPILAGFYSTHEIANSILKETPAGSHAFKKFITELSPNMRSILLSDRKLLDKAVNFFTSYMLVSSGLINPNALDFYINEFPKKVATIRDSTKYKNNAFIDSIIVDTDRKTNKPYIRANLTGMDKATKEKLSMAWLDLYDQDSNLALDFFTYSFFRGGVGFSPRTFMSLFPNRLKKEIKSTLSDGTTMSYNDVYRKMSTSTMNNAIFLDQFIRHNVNSNKLVPLVSKSGMTYDPNTKSYVITSSSKINELSDTPYFKTKNGNNDYDLWRFNKDKSNGDMYVYELTSTLGNNGEYLEMSKTDIKKSLAETTREKDSKNLNDNIESNDTVPTDISMCTDLDNGGTITEEERKESYEELSNEALDFTDRITGRESTVHKTNEVTQEENNDRKLITDSILNSLRSKGFKTKAEDINKEESKLC